MMKQIQFWVLLFVSTGIWGQEADIQVGVYYFDGWTGKSEFHLNPVIQDSFPERKPIWGWVTSTPETIEKQIGLAAEAGISFFNFCWYYKPIKKGKIDSDPKNNAMKLFRQAKNKSILKYACTVANHKGYILQKEDWKSLVEYWCGLFKDPNYVRVNGKPVLFFFSIETLVQTFGGASKVNKAFEYLRQHAVSEGLAGVTIGAILSPSTAREQVADSCGYDLLTGYNMHRLGLSWSQKVRPVTEMQKAEVKAWDQIGVTSGLPQIPVVTLNWDTRPLDLNASLKSGKKILNPRFEGYSGKTVKYSIRSAKVWIQKNRNRVTKEKIIMLYAWNEYGEGAWLTPTDSLKNSLLEGLKEGLNE